MLFVSTFLNASQNSAARKHRSLVVTRPSLSALFHANPVAIARNLALRAKRADRLTQILSVHHEQIVINRPILFGELPPESHFGLIGSFRMHVSQTVGYPVHVSVDGDSLLIKRDGDDDIRGLPAYTRQCEQIIKIARDFSLKPIDQIAANLMNRLRLDAKERNRINRLLDHIHRRRQHTLRVGRDLEQAFACRDCGGVLRPKAQQARNENGKRRLRIIRDRGNGPLPNFTSQDSNDPMYIFRTHV